MHSKNSKWLIEALDDATCEPYFYLVLYHHQESDLEKRVVNKIIPWKYLTLYTFRNNVKYII